MFQLQVGAFTFLQPGAPIRQLNVLIKVFEISVNLQTVRTHLTSVDCKTYFLEIMQFSVSSNCTFHVSIELWSRLFEACRKLNLCHIMLTGQVVNNLREDLIIFFI